jgi:hypothetical protein
MFLIRNALLYPHRRNAHDYRTENVNIVFDVMKRVSESIKKKKGDSSLNIFELSPSVEASTEKSNFLMKDLGLFKEFI